MTSKSLSPIPEIILHQQSLNSQNGTSDGSEQTIPSKRLGDSAYIPNSQNIGCIDYDSAFEDLETFEKLARGYKVDGESRAEICRFNASVSQAPILQSSKMNAGSGRIPCRAAGSSGDLVAY